MAKVIDIHSKPKSGETTIPTCSCGEALVPIVMMGAHPFIVSLKCPECSAEVEVVNGYISEGGDSA
ncbi:MAG: hypothetical protein ACQEW0_16410 [Pseudomonadota bacterium]